ncbi:MAG: nucleoside hydrolase [Bifidobacteriaceae bacterium]|jgi:inosine-uridine nucleoside N-ribohydrolase|nr:nucleoside hydrolase [Bifidobacteriaceae bacterium]
MTAIKPRARLIIDNDFSGDPDGLFQLVHHVLSPSLDIRLVVGSHLGAVPGWDPGPDSAGQAAALVQEWLALLDRPDIPVLAGSNTPMAAPDAPAVTAAAQALVAEAMRDDTDLPLYVGLGGSLTTLASAYRLEPAIAGRLTAIWIGGPEYHGYPAPPGSAATEYNLSADIAAAQVVFASDLPLWQIPRKTYRQLLVGTVELEAKVRPLGEVGRRLCATLDHFAELGLPRAEVYCLGDSGLVAVTALQTLFEADAAACDWEYQPAPTIDATGNYAAPASGARDIRVFTWLDTRLLFEDMYAKLAALAALKP